MANRDIVALGTSAGGVQALLYLAGNFPREFPASVLVTIHMSSQFQSSLDQVLTQAGALPATFVDNGTLLRPGHIYIAPPDRHLIVEDNQLSLGSGPRENNARPAIDAMLRSLALCCGWRSIGVVLTGTLGDGASGLLSLKQRGGLTVVQDPNDATFSGTPLNALKRTNPDYVKPLADIPALLAELVRRPPGAPAPPPDDLRYEVEVARSGASSIARTDALGRRSVFTCPDCHGTMWEIHEGDLTRYRCHVGHTYTEELLAVALDEDLRRALASAQRIMEERAALARKLSGEAEDKGQRFLAGSWRQKAEELDRELRTLQNSTQRVELLSTMPTEQDRANSERSPGRRRHPIQQGSD